MTNLKFNALTSHVCTKAFFNIIKNIIRTHVLSGTAVSILGLVI